MATTEQVWQAVQALYHATDATQRVQANEWLQGYQKSAGAWESLDVLLKTDGMSEETYFFAANSLKSKSIGPDLVEQLDAPAREALGGSLMAHIHKFRNGPSVVRKQLCLAFAAYAGQFDHTLRPVDIVQEVCTTLGASSETVPVLLELLTLLGEEADRVGRDATFLGNEVEHPLVASANRSALAVLNFLHQCFTALSTEPEATRSDKGAAMIACFCRWLRFSKVPPDQLVLSPIVHAAMGGLKDPKTTEASSDLLCELAYISRDVQSCMPIFQALAGNLQNFHDVYQSAVTDEDDALARAVTRIVAEMGESYVEVVARSPEQGAGLVNLLVLCGGHPETRVASITYAFWWRFKECLFNSCSEEERARALELLRQPISQMVLVLAKSACHPEDVDDWGQAEEDEFKNFRLETLWDCVLDLSEMIGGLAFLQALAPHLQAEVERSAGQADRWREVEGSLFLVRAAARYVPDNDETVAPGILSLFQKMPQHYRVRQTFTIVIAKFGRWLNVHPDALGPLLDFVVQGLGLPKLGKSASEALQDLCESCGEHMASPMQLNGLLQIYQSIGSLDIAEQERVVEGIGSVLVRVPGDQLMAMISAVSDPPLTAAKAALEAQDKTAVIAQLKKLRTLIKGGVTSCDRGVGPEVAAARREALSVAWTAQFEKVWPVLESCIRAFVGQEDLMEHLCRCMKSAIQAMTFRFKHFLGVFASAMVNSFLAHPLSCVLYVVDSIVSLFGKLPEFVQPLLEMLTAMSGRTMQALTSPEAFQQSPDIVQEYFELVGRGLRRFPQALLQAPLGSEAFTCAAQSLYTPLAHREALQAIIIFFHNLVLADANSANGAMHQQDRAAAQAFLSAGAPSIQGATQPRGKTMVEAVVRALVTKPAAVMEAVALVILDLGELMRPQRDEWLSAALQSIPETEIAGTVRGAFLSKVYQLRGGSQVRAS
ncbi:armadillo-type protein [Baffinella frigidus]|nr:armadillo-type protein [Cryptophyta sp. CCMP2293]